jgi:hypothetical protein
MNAENELLNAYRDWHRLVRAEAKAIRTRNWDLLADCQLAINDYQALTTRLSEEARAEWERAGFDIAVREAGIRVFIQELIELTRQNQALLQSAKHEAMARIDELGDATRNFRRLRHAYGSAQGLGHAT